MAEFKGRDVSWKKLWQLISGIHYETPNQVVADKLAEVIPELLTGICSKPANTSVAKEIRDKPSLLSFSGHLEQQLGLSAVEASNLICSYLMYEYKGSATSLLNCLSTDQQKNKLLVDISKYYSLERFVMLKIVRNLLEQSNSKNHPYNEEYSNVLDSLKLAPLRKSYISQVEHLIRGPSSQVASGEYLSSGVKTTFEAERKMHEIVELLQIILLIVDRDGISVEEIDQLLELFRAHSFGRQQTGLDGNNATHTDLVHKVAYSEVALFLKCLDASTNISNPTYVEEVIRKLDKYVVTLHQNPEHGPILLSWMLFNYRSSNAADEDEQQVRYRQYGTRATHLGVFDYLHTMISHPMYRDLSSVSRIVRRTIYAHLHQLCDLFDGDGAVAQHAKIYDLLSELLRTPSIAKDFCNREDGVRSLFNTALENFPVEFIPLANIAEAIASTGTAQQHYIRKQLENLPVNTEQIKMDSRFHVKPVADSESEFVLLEPYAPFKKIDFVIPSGTTAVIQDRLSCSTIHFRTSLNFFDVLHNEIDELLVETVRYTDIDDERKARVCAGLAYLARALKGITDPLNEISNEMVHPTEMVFDVLTKFKVVTQPPIELMSKCLEVCATLVPLFDHEIVRRVINLNILPSIGDRADYHALSMGAGFESGLVGYYLINFEKNLGRYDFLITYLKFLRTYTKQPRIEASAGVELPGLIFMLREVLPHVHGWRFAKETDRQLIYTLIFQYFLDILQTQDDPANEYGILMRNVCVYSLLNLDNGMVLLRFVAIGNDHLQSVMQNVSNWMTTSESGLNLLVQLAMTILMQILRLRHSQSDPNLGPHRPNHSLSPLESIIYTQPKQRDTLRIIPVVTSYMSNIFNRRLPLLSCRLLRRFAIEFQMSLLACLDMEPDQIRLTFLQRLPDDLESDQLKIAVIEFVEACINKQPGLTEAFFKIKNERRNIQKGPKPKDIGDGVLTYMTQYLDTIAKDPVRISSPLLSKIMSLFHALWKNNMQSLVQNLISDSDFWTSLFNPLFGPIKPDIQAYSQLFNILGIEMFRSSPETVLDSKLQTVYDRLFQPEHFEKWVDHVLALPLETISDQVSDETPEWLCRLQSFKDLFVLTIRKKSVEIPHQSKTYFANKCLAVLVERSEYLDDYRPFIILAEMYLILLMSFEFKYTESPEEDVIMLEQITQILNQTSISYRDINVRARESVLAIALRSIDLLQKEIFSNHLIVGDFMRSIAEILCFEVTMTENEVIFNKKVPVAESDDQNTAKPHMSLVLSLTLLKKMSESSAAMKFSTKWQQEIISFKIVNRIISCLNASLQVYKCRKIVTEMLDVLIVLAQGSCSSELLHTDIGNYLWMKLLPPKELLQIFASNSVSQTELGGPKASTRDSAVNRRWQTNDWWPIYARGIQLVTVLLQHHRHMFVKDALLFVGVHEEFLVDSILLSKHTMDADAILLIKTALLMVAELVQFEKQWRLEHPSSMINLMRSVQSILDHSVSLLYRPKILKRLMDGVAAPKIDLNFFDSSAVLSPSDELTVAMNELIDVVTISARCLLAFSPKVLTMLVEPDFASSQWQPLVEIQFGAPKLYVGNTTPQLTFGTILSAVTIFTKALNLRQYTFAETPLNKIGINPDQDDSEDELDSTNLLSGASTVQPSSATNTTARFSKTLSMTSNASTTLNAPSNEILTNLDEKRCISALEFTLTLLCSQSKLAMKDDNLSLREKQLIKRELSTELAVFHDFVRKRIMTDSKGSLHRKKRGIAIIRATETSYEAVRLPAVPQLGGERPISAQRNKPSMREKVMRQQHQINTGLTPNMQSLKRPTIDLSPILPADGSTTPRKISNRNLPSSTPLEPAERVMLKPHSKFGGNSSERHNRSIDTVDRAVEEPIYYEPEDASYTGLSMVQMVEADYLHLMSIIFLHICQHD